MITVICTASAIVVWWVAVNALLARQGQARAGKGRQVATTPKEAK